MSNGLTIDAAAALSRLANAVSAFVTGSAIDEVSVTYRLPSDGSSKTKRLTHQLLTGFERVRSKQWPREKLDNLITSLVMEGYQRFLAGNATLTHEIVDAIVDDMATLKLSAAALSKLAWRKDLPGNPRLDVPKSSARARVTPPAHQGHDRPTSTGHPALLAEVKGLIVGNTVSPQDRGRRLEQILDQILYHEGLRPRGPLRSPGEEVDRTFSLAMRHFVLECKWERDPVGFPAVRDFIGKVERKAEGTFGMFLSMSGFASDVNRSAIQGRRLNCVGVTGQHLMEVLEGRWTWARIVDTAIRHAGDRGEFLVVLDR